MDAGAGERAAYCAARYLRPQHSPYVPHSQRGMVGGWKEVAQAREPRRMHAEEIAGSRKNGGFVEHHPMLYAIAIALGYTCGIFRQPRQDIAVGPPSPILQQLRQIPMV